MNTTSHPFTRGGLGPLFAPRSIALIGASEESGSVGRALLENLLKFPGAFFAINRRHDFVLDRRCYPGIKDVPVSIDLAVIAVPAPLVAGIIRECGEANVPAAVVISAGFGECGIDGKRLEQDLVAAAREARVRVLGPNCLGFVIPHPRVNATFGPCAPHLGRIAFLSQSGALCAAVLDWSRRDNVGLSALVSVGGMADIGWPELIRWFARDPQTDRILLYIESVRDGEAFVEAAREATAIKPVIVLKAGRTLEGARTAMTHTGSLCGRDDVFSAALRRAGVLRAYSVEELFGMAELLAVQSPPKGDRLAIVTNAGGAAALAADAYVLRGGSIAKLSTPLRTRLDEVLPKHWSHDNPVDVLGDCPPQLYGRTVSAVLDDPENDGVVAILTPQSMTDPTAAAHELVRAAERRVKPLLACWMGGEKVEEGRRVLHEARIPDFEFPEPAAIAFAQLAEVGRLMRQRGEPLKRNLPFPKAAEPARAIIQFAQSLHRSLLSELETKRVLAAHGILSGEVSLCQTVEQAIAGAEALGYPVVLKVHSHLISHKASHGGVKLGLRDADAVRRAWKEIHSAIVHKLGQDHFDGITVQPMVHNIGAEFLLGAHRDPHFGPVVTFGAGGRLVELMKDRQIGLAPVNKTEAASLIAATRIAHSMTGLGTLATAALAEAIARFSEILLHHPELRSIEANPLVWDSERFIALDARSEVIAPASYPPTVLTKDQLSHEPKIPTRPIEMHP
jgi:acetyltransferase